MSDVFLSYASADRPRIKSIAEALHKCGYSVWWDPTILPGRIWRREIEAALDASHCVVVVWSAASVGSEWVDEEASEGRRRGILVPVLIDEVAIPLGYRRLQAANLIHWDGSITDAEFEKFLKAVAGCAPIEDIAASTPQPPERQKSGVEALKNELFNVREEAVRLAEEFERIRFETDFSNERTQRLEATYTKMLSRAPFYSDLLVEFLKSTSPGQRLLAISVLETFPNPDHLSWLAERLYPHPDTAFIRYHAAVALLVAVRTLDRSSCPLLESAVRRAKEYVSRDTDDGSRQRNEIVADAEAELKTKCQL